MLLATPFQARMGSCSTALLVFLKLAFIVVMYSSIGARSTKNSYREGSGVLHSSTQNYEYECEGDEEAMEALASEETVDIQRIPGLGISFYYQNPDLLPLLGGPNVTRGLVILPDDSIAPEAYAPYAISTAKVGHYAIIVNNSTKEHVIGAMMQHPELVLWSLVGHGIVGGTLASKIAITLYPKVKSLLLLGAQLHDGVDLRDKGMAIAVVYGEVDEVVSSASVESSLSRMPGETSVYGPISRIGHYDLVYSTCNKQHSSSSFIPSHVNDEIMSKITSWIAYLPSLAQFFVASKRALSFGDNSRLEPGHNNSKPYPQPFDQSKSWLVSFDEVPQPNTIPQRSWWIFRPYKNQSDGNYKDYTNITGGLIYYPGGYVDGRAYFPIAFHIAAMGHLVVIVQQPNYGRESLFIQDANIIIESTNPILSVVPKGKWAIGGHSYGGTLTSMYLYYNPTKVYGLVLHAGRVSFNLSNVDVPVLQVFGTLDDVAEGGYERYIYRYKDLVNQNITKFIAIEGANHHQTGDYGYQPPDDIATISNDDQQKVFARKTIDFLDNSLSHQCF